MNTVIEVSNVSKTFGKGSNINKVLDEACMYVSEGEFVSLMGASGSGKSTLLYLIGGLDRSFEGKITLCGEDIASLKENKLSKLRLSNLGFVFQFYNLVMNLNVEDNILLPATINGKKKSELKKELDEILEITGLTEKRKAMPATLSGGQQQRVAIARTLAPKPKVLFMDEPLSNLDAKLRLEMRIELKRLHTDTDSTFVYVTHDQLEAMTLSSRICLIKNGLLQQFDPPMETYSNPANIFVADFVGNPSMNFIQAKGKITGEKTAQISFFGKTFSFKSKEALGKLSGDDVIVGIRPEFIHLEKEGLQAKVYGTLPAGMETTVKLDVDGFILTSVKFGSVDYKLNSTMSYSIEGDGIILFDKESTKNIGKGTLALS